MLTQDIMEAIGHELSFWKGFVANPRFISGWVPGDVKTPDLQDEVYNYLRALPNYDQMSVLDVGSGAVSILNGTFPSQNIVCVDPLGSLYPVIFDYASNGLRPPLPYGGEEMNFEAQFDIVHCSNAIDHSQEPIRVYKNMHRACKSGGLVIVQSFVDEAVFENWQGFHQYNFKMSEDGVVSYTDKFGNETRFGGNQVFKAIKKNHYQGKDFFISIWRKQ